MYHWAAVEPQFKEILKQALLGSLATPSTVVRKQVASAIAAVAAIEIPLKQWPDLITNLCNNAAHD